MALISCPECAKKISETTPVCPHCGYQLSTETSSNTTKPTKIGEVHKKPIAGICTLFIGIIAIPCSFLAGPFLALPLIGAIVITGAGCGLLVGTQSVTCPYCGRPAKMLCNNDDFRCAACKKRSVRKGEYLNLV